MFLRGSTKWRRIGFDRVIDFEKEDFTKSGKAYDLIVDTKTTRAL